MSDDLWIYGDVIERKGHRVKIILEENRSKLNNLTPKNRSPSFSTPTLEQSTLINRSDKGSTRSRDR
ncbi:MAG: hypothetical protein R6U38_14760 [Desulfatiglandaceae bacterium]